MQYVPDDLKDDKYWARRRKNNMAAKRSRDARRVKENQIAMRAAFLEKEVVSAFHQFILFFPISPFPYLSCRCHLVCKRHIFAFRLPPFCYLYLQNAVLRAELDKVTKLYASALKRLEQYEKPAKKYWPKRSRCRCFAVDFFLVYFFF